MTFVCFIVWPVSNLIGDREKLTTRRSSHRCDLLLPPHPTEGKGRYRRQCGCRKPASGLIARALAEWKFNAYDASPCRS